MLRFDSPLDRIIIEILDNSIGYMIDQINDLTKYEKSYENIKDEMESLLPNASNVFNPATALNVLKKLLQANGSAKLYYLNDYHYLLLYDTLDLYCNMRNGIIDDIDSDEERKEWCRLGDYYVEEIDFNRLIGIFFFDTDFLIGNEDMLAIELDKRQEMGFNDEAFALTQGLAPHPEELELEEQEDEDAFIMESSRYFGSGSKVYPDYDQIPEP